MATPTLKMLWLTMVLAGLAVLVAGDKINTTSTTASPKVKVSTTTTITNLSMSTTKPATVPFAAVMDLFQAPLASFKPKMHDNVDKPMGRDQQNTPSTPATSNIFFKAGSNLGSAASSLTGWFNNRMIPQALRPSSTTTAAPVIAIIPSQQIRRKVVSNFQHPVVQVSDDIEENDEVANDDDDDDENNFNLDNDMIEADDDDYEYEPVKNRKGYRQTQKRPNKQYFYIEEELSENDDYDYDVELPVKKPQRKQQNLSNKRRKNSAINKQQKRRKPVRRIQKPQKVQYINRPSQTQVKRKGRPSSTFELVPISQNQALNSIQTKKPSSTAETNQQRPGSQFLSIPWTRLGFSGPSQEQTSNEQQSKPIVIRIPQQNQQNIKRKRRPTGKPAKAVKNPKRRPLKGQLQNQMPVFSILSEDQIREILQPQLNQPSKATQSSNLPVILDAKKKPPKKQSEQMPSNNNVNAEKPDERPQAEKETSENQEHDTFIVVGPSDDEDDKEIDLNLYRHYNSRRGFKSGRISPRLSDNWDEDDDDYEE